MTLRTLFAFFGLLTCVSASAFLFLFQPPDKAVRSQRPPELARRIWWLSAREYLLWIALGLGGARLVVSNIANSGSPIIFHSWVDLSFAIFTVVVSAVASLVALGVYLAYRSWGKGPLP